MTATGPSTALQQRVFRDAVSGACVRFVVARARFPRARPDVAHGSPSRQICRAPDEGTQIRRHEICDTWRRAPVRESNAPMSVTFTAERRWITKTRGGAGLVRSVLCAPLIGPAMRARAGRGESPDTNRFGSVRRLVSGRSARPCRRRRHQRRTSVRLRYAPLLRGELRFSVQLGLVDYLNILKSRRAPSTTCGD